MSDLNIRINLDTNAAEAGANDVRNDLNRIRTAAERPVKINVDTSELAGAAGGAGKLKEALGNVQAAALGELSQKAAELGGHLGGVAGSIAEVAIKSAAAFGPMGIALTAVLAAVSLVVQGIEEMNKEARATEELALIERNLGSAFQDVQRNIIGAKDATESLTIAIRNQQTLLASNAQLLNAGFNTESIENFRRAGRELLPEIQRQGGAFRNVTQAQLEQAIVSRDAGVLAATFGVNIRFSGNAAVDAALAVDALEARTRELSRSHEDSTTSIVRNSLALKENEKLINVVAAASEAMAQAARDKAIANDRLQAARSAAASAESAAQRRAGMEALRVAEEGIIADQQASAVVAQRRNQQALSFAFQISESAELVNSRAAQTRAEQALTFAVGETNRARAASVRGGQTAAERTALITSLNNEATARRGVAEAAAAEEAATVAVGDAARERVRIADQLEMTRATENKGTQAAQLAREQVEADAILTRSQGNKAELNRQDAARANEIKAREEMLAGSAGKLGEAQIAAAFAAAAAGENAGEAMQKALKASLMGLAQESAIKALYATATGLFQLATLNPAAATTLTSAAMFAGVAVAAGVGGALIPAVAAAPSAGGGGGAGMAGPAGATPMRSGGGGSDEAPKNITINFSAFQSNEQAQALIVRSLREAGYNGRARVGSSFSAERR
jgi:hypothetical protein